MSLNEHEVVVWTAAVQDLAGMNPIDGLLIPAPDILTSSAELYDVLDGARQTGFISQDEQPDVDEFLTGLMLDPDRGATIAELPYVQIGDEQFLRLVFPRTRTS